MTGRRYSAISSRKVSSVKLTNQLPSLGPMEKPPETFLLNSALGSLPRALARAPATQGSSSCCREAGRMSERSADSVALKRSATAVMIFLRKSGSERDCFTLSALTAPTSRSSISFLVACRHWAEAILTSEVVLSLRSSACRCAAPTISSACLRALAMIWSASSRARASSCSPSSLPLESPSL